MLLLPLSNARSLSIMLRMFITTLANNLIKFNKIDFGGSNSICLWLTNAVSVDLLKTDGVWDLVISPTNGNPSVSFKVGKNPKINKGLINKLEVWFHREHRDSYQRGLETISDDISRMSLRESISKIGLFQRFLVSKNKININSLYSTSDNFNELLTIRAEIAVSLVGTVYIYTGVNVTGVHGFLRNYLSTRIGHDGYFTGKLRKDPIDKWFKEILYTHVEETLK